MTITSVVLGEGAPEGGWGKGASVCASTDAAGSTDIRKGMSSLMVYLDSVVLVAGFGSLQFRPATSRDMVGLASTGRTCTVANQFIAFPSRWWRLARLSDICPRHLACDTMTKDRFLLRNRSQTRLARQRV